MGTPISDYNLAKINTKEYEDILRGTIDFGANLFVMATRGSGKTDITRTVIREMGLKEVYLNVSIFDKTDLGGYPRLLDAKNSEDYIRFLLPHYYKELLEGDQKCVVLFDEIDKITDPSVTAPLLEFTQFHTINGKPFKNLQACIMTGNFASEGGSRPSLPLLDRALKYLMEPSVQHWMDWSAKTGEIHPSITAYINDHPEDLFGESDPGELYADRSPRGWHNFSKLLKFGEEKRWSTQMLATMASGYIGKRTGIKYNSYFQHYQVILPVIEKIVKGEQVSNEFKKMEPTKQLVTCMVVGARLARVLDELKSKNKMPAIVDNIGKFLQVVDPEMALISFRSQIGLHRSVSSGIDEIEPYDSLLRTMAKRIKGQ